MQKRATTIQWFCRTILFGAIASCVQINAADVARPKKFTQTDDCKVMFPSFIDVSACAGFPLQWSSQELQADHATGDFDTTWSPTQPNVLNVSGHLDATTFNANLKCATGTGGPTGTISATGSNNTYTGTYTLGGNSGPVTITLVPGQSKNNVPTVNAALTPNPANVGDMVVMKGTITPPAGHMITANDRGTISFGDGSAAMTASGPQFIPMLKAGIQHQYQSAGVFDVNLYFDRVGDPPGNGYSLDYIAVIGANSIAVNGSNGLNEVANVASGGVIGLHIKETQVIGATDAKTKIEDAAGNLLPPPGGVLQGLDVGQTVTSAGLTVATSDVLDMNGSQVGRIRKTVGVSDMVAGVQGALGNPKSTALAITSVKGKFTFNLSKPDDVTFSGQFQLPPGYSPTLSGANTMQFSMGNVVDTVQLSTKGKSTLVSRGRIKKLSIKFRKLPNGVAVGGEIAKISAEFNAKDLTGAGFDTEGILNQPGDTEKGAKLLTRFIQVNMLFAGVNYEVLAPVSYSIGANGTFGTIASRHQ